MAYILRNKPSKIWARVLIAGLARHGSSVEVAINSGVHQGYVENLETNRKSNCLLYTNDNGGSEITIPIDEPIKSTIGPKGIATISETSADKVYIFNDVLGYLKWSQKLHNDGSKDKQDYIIIGSGKLMDVWLHMIDNRPEIKNARYMDNEHSEDLARLFSTTDIDFGVVERWRDAKRQEPKTSGGSAWDTVSLRP